MKIDHRMLQNTEVESVAFIKNELEACMKINDMEAVFTLSPR